VKTAFVDGLLCVVSALGLNAHGAVCLYDKQIDQLVYELYDRTEKEIEIAEEATK